MQEFELIKLLTSSLVSNPAVVEGVGDDCAVLDLGRPDQWVLFKTDAVVEGVHFKQPVAAERVGHKALGRCLSDIAAMAGTPVAALVTLGLPAAFDPVFLQGIYSGINTLASQHGVAVVGGETTANPAGIFISVAFLGTVARDRCILRRGAQPGDALFVTGELGGSLAGRHLTFEPRLEQARWLASQFAVHSMIDLSDGLAGDLRHLLAASGVGAELLSSAIPVSRAAREAELAGGKPAVQSALTDGEDFELLFTVASQDAVKLLDAWKSRFSGLRLSCIGRIISEAGVRIRDKAGEQVLTAHGYVHFKES